MSRHRARHLVGQGSGGSRLGSPLGRPSSLGLLGDSDPKQSPLSSLPLWTPGRSAPSSQRSDGTLGLAWIAARRSRPPAKRALLRRCTPHISSLPHPQFYPSGPQRRLPLPTPLAGGAVLPGERSAASRRAASGRGRPRLLSEKKRALSEARRAPISGRDGEDRLRGGLVRAERIEPPPGWPSQAAMGSGLQRGRVSAA